MPNWPAEHAATSGRAFAWTAAWLVLAVALWPLPGPAEAVLSLGALAVAGQLGWLAARGRTLPLDRRAFVLAGLLFAAYWLPELLSAPDALDRGRAWKEVVADLRYLPLLWGVAIAVREPRGRGWLLGGIALVAFVWSMDALLQAMAGSSPLFAALDALKGWSGGGPLCPADEVLAPDRINGIFGACNPKLGLVLASLSPFALAWAATRARAWAWCVAAAVLGVAILLGGARAAWLTFGLVALVSGWRVLGARRLAGFALAGVLALVALYVVSPQLQQRVERTALALQADAGGVDGALSGRGRIWRGALCMAREHPLNGVGVRGFRQAWPVCDPAAADAPAWGEGDALHAHQLLLELLSETGVLGLLAWLGGAWMAWRAWRQAGAAARRQAGPAGLALVATTFPLNTHLAFYSTFWGGVLVLLAGLYVGLLHARTGCLRPVQVPGAGGVGSPRPRS